MNIKTDILEFRGQILEFNVTNLGLALLVFPLLWAAPGAFPESVYQEDGWRGLGWPGFDFTAFQQPT